MINKITEICFVGAFLFDAIYQSIQNESLEIDLPLLIIAITVSLFGSLVQIFEKKKKGKIVKYETSLIIVSGVFIAYLIYEIGIKTKLNQYIMFASALGGYVSLDLLYGVKRIVSSLPDFIIKYANQKYIKSEEKPEDDEKNSFSDRSQ